MHQEDQAAKIVRTVIAALLSIAGGFIIGTIIILTLWSDATTGSEYWLANLIPTFAIFTWAVMMIWRPKRK